MTDIVVKQSIYILLYFNFLIKKKKKKAVIG